MIGVRRWTGWAGLSLLALGIGPSSAAISLSYLLLFVFALTTRRELAALWHSGWTVRLLLLLTLYVLIQGLLVGALQETHTFSAQDLQHMVRTVCLGTLLTGWALYATRFPPTLFCALFVAGFLATTGQALLEHRDAFFELRRMNYLRSPNELGLLGGTTFLIGLFICGGSTLRYALQERRPIAASIAGGLAFALTIGGIWLWLQSGSRSTWAGLLAAVSVLAVIGAYVACRHRHTLLPFMAGIVVAVIVLGTLTTYYAGDILPRIERELPSIQAIMQGDTEALLAGRDAGTNARFIIWDNVLRDILARPVFGWGSGAVTSLFDEAINAGKLRPGWTHAHNLYLHLALFLGIPAMALWIGAHVRLFAVASLSAMGTTSRRSNIGWFVLAWGVFFAVSSLFQVRMHSAYGAAFFIAFTGLALALYLDAKLPASHTKAENRPETTR